MPPRHLTAADIAARQTYVLKPEVADLNQRLEGLPPGQVIWSTDRPESGFGSGEEPTWTHTGNGTSVSFAVAGRITIRPARYIVLIGGVQQAPNTYSLPANSETIVFVAPPPAGEPIVITAPFYGASE